MSNYKRLNTNTLQLGQDEGTCSIIPQTSNRIKCQMDLVKSTGANLIDYDESSNTIDFNNTNIANFSGGGAGGGDVFLANPNTFTAVNTFNANTVLSTVDTGNVTTTGTINASSTVTGASLVTAGTVECDKVESVGNVEIGTGDLVVTTGNCTVSGNCTISGTTSVAAISTNNITTTGTIACNSNIQGASLSATAGDISCTTGNINGLSLQSSGGQVNLKTGNARIEDDTNNDVRIQADANTNLIVGRLGATGADNLQLSYNSVSNKTVLQLYDFSRTSFYPVGQNPDDLTGLISSIENTSLTFNGSTTGTFQGSLVSTGTSTLSGTVVNLGTGSNTATISCMNSVADRMNVVAGKIQLDATATLAKTGTTSGATDIFTATDTILDRSATSFTPTLFNLVTTTPTAGQIQLDGAITNSVQSSIQAVRFGTNSGTAVYRVSCRGRLTGFEVDKPSAGSINLFTLPAGYRPTIEQNIISQGHGGDTQVRIDISTTGLVSIAEGASTDATTFCNLGTIDFWAGI